MAGEADRHDGSVVQIVTPGAATDVIRRGNAPTWCYLGRDESLQHRIRSQCGDAVSVGVALTEVALRLKQPFLDWIAAIGSKQRQPVIWWASAVASKSPLQSDLFFLVCYGEILADWSAGESPAQVIVIEDAWLWAAAREWFCASPRMQFTGTREESVAVARGRLRRRARAQALRFVASAVRTVIRARAVMPRHVPPRADQQALIFTWIEARAFAPDGAFRDPYTGRLASILTAHGVPVSRLTPLAAPRALWASVQASAEEFVVTPAFARIGDALRAVRTRFRIDADAASRRFLGRDHGPLLERECLVENASASFREHLVWFAAVRRIAALMRDRRMTVIYPFENQPHEKLLCLAWRQAAPEATLVGYVTAGIPTLLLSFFLGAGEDAFQPLPDTIVTNGPASRDLLETNGYASRRLIDGGAFRFEHLADLVSAGTASVAGPIARVLVPLPTVACYARELLASLAEAFREPLLDPSSGRPVECVVTFHVDLPRERVVDETQTLPPSIVLSSQGVGELLSQSALCVFVPPTGSWREALIAGVPVLRYRPDTLDLDPIDALAGLELPDCSRATLREALVASLRSPAIPTRDDRARLLNRLYSPVNEAVWLSLAGPSMMERTTMKAPHE